MSLSASSTSNVHEDYKDDRVSTCIFWTIDDVANWIEGLGFPYYKDCFVSNRINGRKLLVMEASNLPKIGITDWTDIKIITEDIRPRLGIEDPDSFRSISLLPRTQMGMYLERKSKTGEHADELSFKSFLHSKLYSDAKWQPPLSNQCLILPH